MVFVNSTFRNLTKNYFACKILYIVKFAVSCTVIISIFLMVYYHMTSHSVADSWSSVILLTGQRCDETMK